MSFLRGSDRYGRLGLEPISRVAGAYEAERRSSRTGHLGTGTLACSRCDAPVSLGTSVVLPTDMLTCPFCSHRGAVRDFLSLATPTRPARVEVRIRIARGAIRPAAGRAGG